MLPVNAVDELYHTLQTAGWFTVRGGLVFVWTASKSLPHFPASDDRNFMGCETTPAKSFIPDIAPFTL
jgi:hypothetical protein